MGLPAQQYALLANDAYRDYRVGRQSPGAEEQVVLGGERYRVLIHQDNPRTGYQGTVYQNVAGGDIVVAHRGTEFDRQLYLDGIRADGSMVVARTNPQADDAIALTRQAMAIAREQGQRSGQAPEVSVTGHSLGGALAQITAHHFDLKGQTFNAYGAHSLGYRIPEGGQTVLNHVMASDFVAAASGHFGKVQIYATEADIQRLSSSGYSNSRANFLLPDYPLVAAGRSVDAHKMHNFLDEDGKGGRDVSVLRDPAARQRADDNARMIAEYRDDIRGIRSGITLLSRDAPGLFKDALDGIRGPLAPGEPARKETSSLAPRIDQADNPAHALFAQAEPAVRQLDAQHGRNYDDSSRQLAGALAASMYAAGGQRIDTVVLSRDASQAFAVQGRPEDPAHLRASVAVEQGLNMSLADSGSLALQAAQSQAQDAQVRNQQQEHSAPRMA